MAPMCYCVILQMAKVNLEPSTEPSTAAALIAQHRFLGAAKAPKRHLFAGDGYHLSAGEGVEELAEILVRSLEKIHGPGILAPFSRVPTRHIIYACHHCGTKGHVNENRYEYCRP
ncbi:uncharacterized protein LOC144112701 isoform X1 [Amblyomma americanum]